MYITASLIVKRLSGIPYPDFVRDHIFAPLGLSSTTFNITAAKASGHLAEGFAVVKSNVSDGEGWFKHTFKPIPFFLPESSAELNAGPGGVITSARDLVCPTAFLMSIGR